MPKLKEAIEKAENNGLADKMEARWANTRSEYSVACNRLFGTTRFHMTAIKLYYGLHPDYDRALILKEIQALFEPHCDTNLAYTNLQRQLADSRKYFGLTKILESSNDYTKTNQKKIATTEVEIRKAKKLCKWCGKNYFSPEDGNLAGCEACFGRIKPKATSKKCQCGNMFTPTKDNWGFCKGCSDVNRYLDNDDIRSKVKMI